ncbi:MAG: acyl phosphate:glycerol-3-phosphate acyltransferase [Candidatus Eremiobacteraeota bacterium]|nr:acyl phosphate:glycerol-3-phosphate acyltransferase [Candidatus Eremiobacteraeota bacterium]
MWYAVAVLLGYLLGSIPISLLVARAHGVDLRATADGNPGAWNALQQLGARRAWPAFVGDGVKGTAAGLIGLELAGIAGAYVAVAAAMVGHALPLFARFRGGKSVMTFAGGAFALSPVAAAIALAACALVALAARSFTWGARLGVFGFPLVQLALDPPARVAATGALMSLIGMRFLLARRSDALATSAPDEPRAS